MSVLIVSYEPDGSIIDWRYEADDEYEPGEGEMEWDGDHRKLSECRIDTSASPPEVVEDPPEMFEWPGVVDEDLLELIASEFLSAGSDAIEARDAMASNENIPQSVVDLADAQIRMHYLVYVSLTGERIESVEDRFFGSS